MGLSYVEISATDVPRAAAFYESLFGWSFDRSGGDAYWTFDADGSYGALEQGPVPADSPVLLYVSVRAIDEVLPRVAEAGGEVLRERTPIPGSTGGWYALVRDPSGVRLGLSER